MKEEIKNPKIDNIFDVLKEISILKNEFIKTN